MSIETQEELDGLRRVGRVVAETLRELRRRVAAGVTTGELDALAARIFARHGARSAPAIDVGFPRTICISVDDEAVHGIPGPRRLRSGDLVTLDVTAELDGFYADAAVSVPVGQASPAARRLCASADAGLRKGMEAARAGRPMNAIGRAVQLAVEARGHTVLGELHGHGIGRAMHEPPSVPHVYVREERAPLTEGLVLTIEPIVTAGVGRVRAGDDGWTVLTADGALSAHAEHTVVITAGRPLVLTA